MTTTMNDNPKDENAPKAEELGEWAECPFCTKTRRVVAEAVIKYGLPECACGGEMVLKPKGWQPEAE